MSGSMTLEEIREAAENIAGVAHRTPVLTCRALDEMAGRRLFFKCEQFQKVGAFKFRGAYNAVFHLGQDVALRGVVTHSSGNHAQALALAAKLRNIPAHIVMPETASPVKRAAVEGYGGDVILCQPTLEARESTAQEVQQRTGATLIHPYDNTDIIAGQGTATLELCEQLAERGVSIDAVIAPVGGGGLLAGMCIAGRGCDRNLRMFAGEPEGADDAARSLAAGKIILSTTPNSIADGLLTNLGQLNWPIIYNHIEEIVTVSDEQIVAAMRLLWERAKLLVEPSAAVALAAVFDDQFRQLEGIETVGLILSGGNVSLDKLPW